MNRMIDIIFTLYALFICVWCVQL